MPIYEYQCHQCERQFEKIVRGDEKPHCPFCQSENPERLFSASPVISTQKSRSQSFNKARQAASAVKKEKDHAQREYEINYMKDHS